MYIYDYKLCQRVIRRFDMHDMEIKNNNYQENVTAYQGKIRAVESRAPENNETQYNAYEAFIKLQADCENTPVNATNDNMKYATLEQWTNTIKPKLAKHGFSLSFSIVSQNVEQGNIISIQMKACLMYKNGQTFSARAVFPIDEAKQQKQFDNGNATQKVKCYERTPMQNMGATITYGRRYLIGMLLNLTTTQDDTDGCAIPAQKSKIETIKTLIKETNADEAKILQFAGVTNINDISWEKAAVIINKLSKRRQ